MAPDTVTDEKSTATGTVLTLGQVPPSPLPRAPLELSPQQATVPAVSMAQVKF